MMHAITVRRCCAALVLTAALLAAFAAWAASPSSAQQCKSGNFCLWANADGKHGFYFFDGNDPNLHNDRFSRRMRVGDNATVAKNNGFNGAVVGVLVYKDTRYRGPRLCVPLGAQINLSEKRLPQDHDKGQTGSEEPDGTWNDDVSSFRWVSECF
jgi:hypothetical protein